MLAALLGYGQSVVAQSYKGRPSVQYEAHAACPPQSRFVERMRARMRADGTRVPSDVTLRVTLQERAAFTHGSVEIARGATRAQRTVDAERCEEVVEALALIAALALREQDDSEAPRARKRKQPNPDQQASTRDALGTQPARGTDAAPPDAPAPNPTASPQPSAANTGEPASDATATSAHTQPTAANAGEPTADARRRLSASETTRPSARSKPAEADAESRQPRDAGADGLHVSVGAAVLLLSGLAPSLQPGLQLRAALAMGAFSLQLGARIARPDHIAAEGGEATLRFTGGIVRLCASRNPGLFALSACATLEPGVFSARGENTVNARSHSRFWLAAGAAAELGFRAASWLWLRGGAEVLTPYRRDRVSLGGDTLYRIPVLGLRLQLGLEIPFE